MYKSIVEYTSEKTYAVFFKINNILNKKINKIGIDSGGITCESSWR